MKPSLVIALGGNAISKPSLMGAVSGELDTIYESMGAVAKLVEAGYEKILITHGNGPQVGAAILRNELSAKYVAPEPMDICVADTQGSLGYIIEQSLINCLNEKGIEKNIAALITQVCVDPHDQAFDNPTKPIGRFYGKKEAQELMVGRNWVFKDFPREGWRRVVASPKPIDIKEKEIIKHLFNNGFIVIAGGGGGVPIAVNRQNKYYGVEAVVDKDYVSALIAAEIGAQILLIMTGVEFVYTGFGTPNQKPIRKISQNEISQCLGEFEEGSMKPKIEASLTFLANGGKEVIITSIPNCLDALKGKRGTHITP